MYKPTLVTKEVFYRRPDDMISAEIQYGNLNEFVETYP